MPGGDGEFLDREPVPAEEAGALGGEPRGALRRRIGRQELDRRAFGKAEQGDKTMYDALAPALASLIFSAIVTAVIGLALRATVGWRVSDDDEVAGIDQSEHAESGYDLVARGGRLGTPSSAEPSHDARHADELTSEGVKA